MSPERHAELEEVQREVRRERQYQHARAQEEQPQRKAHHDEEHRAQDHGDRKRIRYAITKAGREALALWLKEAPAPPRE